MGIYSCFVCVKGKLCVTLINKMDFKDKSDFPRIRLISHVYMCMCQTLKYTHLTLCAHNYWYSGIDLTECTKSRLTEKEN